MSLTPLVLTLQLIAVSVTIAAAIGIVGAWAESVLQSAGRIGRFAATSFRLAMIAAVATPLVLHASAWEATAGKFGWATMTQTGTRADPAGVYGFFSGLIASGWIHGAFGAAIVALATCYGTTTTPSGVVQQSRLEMGPIARWWKVRLPIAGPWVIASLIAVALIAASEMTVVDLYGYETVADRFYLYNTIDPSLGQILWTCAVPLSVAGALLMWLFVSRRRILTFQSSGHEIESETPAKSVTVICFAVTSFVAGAVALVPLVGLVIKAGHIVVVQNETVHASWSAVACLDHLLAAPRLFAAEYRWTATVGLVTGLTSTLIAWALAMAGRSQTRIGQTIDLAAVLAFAIPGPVIGMSVVLMFQLPVPGSRILYGQTIVPMVIALSVRAVPVAYWVLRSGYRGISDQVLDTARLDLSTIDRARQVDGPLLRVHLILAWLASGLYASGDVPSVLPVMPAGVTTVGTRLFELLHSGARYQEASLAIWYVGAVVAFVFVVGFARIPRYQGNE